MSVTLLSRLQQVSNEDGVNELELLNRMLEKYKTKQQLWMLKAKCFKALNLVFNGVGQTALKLDWGYFASTPAPYPETITMPYIIVFTSLSNINFQTQSLKLHKHVYQQQKNKYKKRCV